MMKNLTIEKNLLSCRVEVPMGSLYLGLQIMENCVSRILFYVKVEFMLDNFHPEIKIVNNCKKIRDWLFVIRSGMTLPKGS